MSFCNDPGEVPGPNTVELVTFIHPPIDEVALAVQFAPQTVDFMQASHFRDGLKNRFPTRQEHQARPPMSEDFTDPAERPQVQFEVLNVPSMPRFWFVSADESELVQLQHDVLIYNWRRRAVDAQYPGYTAVRASMKEMLGQLNEVLAADDERPSALTPNWCEVTYVNQIASQDGSIDRPPLSRLLRGVEMPRQDSLLPETDDAQIHLRWTIQGDKEPRGRLTVALSSATRLATHVPIWAMSLTTRILAADEGIDAALAALDDGHDWAYRAFIELTSEEMHAYWQTEGSR